MSSRPVLAIDFGTANTYFCKCPDDEIKPKGVDLDGDGRDGLDTVILLRQGKEPLVGRPAYEEFGEATNEERRGYSFHAQFKPDIVVSPQAREHATAFLKAVLENARRQFVDIEPMDRRVIFGVPAEANQTFRDTLSDIAAAAGYGRIETREEPLGGMFYHVSDRTIAPSDAMRGLLVIDFGGGTCDFTFTFRGKISKSWGDMNLGGRIFDDLFFQWLMEQNPQVAAALDPADEFYVLSYHCRKLKEGFSSEMTKRGRDGSFSRSVGNFGRLSEATWSSFVNRASNYQPSSAFLRHLRLVQADALFVGRDDPIDLIDWFRRCMVDGLTTTNVDRSEIATVILTGGSSQWPFVADIVQETLYIDPKRIRRSDRPYVAIAEGLAIAPALRHALRKTRKELEQDLPRFLREQIDVLVESHVNDAAKDIADRITSELFDFRIKTTLVRFRETGGKIADLRSAVATQAQDFEPILQAIALEATGNVAKGLPGLVVEELRKWFEAKGAKSVRELLSFDGSCVSASSINASDVPDVLADFNRLIAGVFGGVVGTITASVCGGSGTAIIMTGPIGWLIGLLVGAAVAYLAASKGMEAARAHAESISLPSWSIRIAMRDSKIDDARRSLRLQTEKQVLLELNTLRTTLNEELEDLVKKEIDALSELHQL